MITNYTINQYINQLKKVDPELIVIFGSAAVDPSRANDLDLFVVKKTKKIGLIDVLTLNIDGWKIFLLRYQFRPI